MTSTRENTIVEKRRWLVFVCILAAVTHAVFYFLRPDTPLSPDESEYIALGVGLAETGDLRLPTGEVAKRMPLYPAFLATIYGWQGPDLWHNAVLVIQTLLAWCCTIIIALTAEQLAGGRAGWMAGTVAAFYSPFRLLQMSFLTEIFLIFFLSLALLIYCAIGIRARSAPARWAALAGVSLLIGLGILTRANALLFIVPFALDAVWRGGSAGQRAGRVGLLLVPALATAGWWAARNSRELGALALSTSGGLNLYLGHNAKYARDPGLGGETDYGAFDRLRREQGLSEVEADRRLYGRGRAFIAAHPWQTVANAVRKIAVWLRPSVPQAGPLTLVLGLGVVTAAGWQRWRAGDLTGSRRSVYLLVLAGFAGLTVCLALALREANLPLTTPLYVVPVGLLALILCRGRPHARGLLIGLVASQLLVAVAFIPLARLRWVADPILIVALGVGVSHVSNWLCRRPGDPAGRSVASPIPPKQSTSP